MFTLNSREEKAIRSFTAKRLIERETRASELLNAFRDDVTAVTLTAGGAGDSHSERADNLIEVINMTGDLLEVLGDILDEIEIDNRIVGSREDRLVEEAERLGDERGTAQGYENALETMSEAIRDLMWTRFVEARNAVIFDGATVNPDMFRTLEADLLKVVQS